MLDDPTPINYGNAGCPAMVRRGVGQWTSCGQVPTHAGWVGTRRKRYRVFPCDQHAGHVEEAAPMTDADRAELQRRRDEQERELVAAAPKPPQVSR